MPYPVNHTAFGPESYLGFLHGDVKISNNIIKMSRCSRNIFPGFILIVVLLLLSVSSLLREVYSFFAPSAAFFATLSLTLLSPGKEVTPSHVPFPRIGAQAGIVHSCAWDIV